MKQIQMIRTPSGPLALVRQTAEKLLAEGVISGTLDGDLHAADAATVKAGIMASAICDFCSAPGATHYFDVPDFGIGKLPGNMGAGRSTGGWMACDTCDDLIRANKRTQLVSRAAENMAFPKFSQRAIGELLDKFWQGMDDKAAAAGIAAALGDYVEDRLPMAVQQPRVTDRDLRIDGVCQATGLTRVQVQAILGGEVDRDALAKLVAFEKQFGKLTDKRGIVDRFMNGPRKPLADIVPHWQRALDAKFQALAQLTGLLKATSRSEYFPDAVDMNDPTAVLRMTKMAESRTLLREMCFDEDVKYLRAAQAYSFNADTTAAIREAAKGIPHDAPLSSIETPNTGAGWFWFAEPLPVVASRMVSDHVHALLWGWSAGPPRVTMDITVDDELLANATSDQRSRIELVAERLKSNMTSRSIHALAESPEWTELATLLGEAGVTREQLDRKSRRTEEQGEPALMFSAYVLDEKGQYVSKGSPSPSTRWYWPLSLSFRDMLAFNAGKWRESYGAGALLEHDPAVMGEAATLACVSELSLFFVMACLWFKQTVPVLTRAPGHVERHARKRLVREHQLKEPPTVQVVALRKSQRVPAEDAPAERQEGAREYGCRWVVQGHPRLQACGPARKDRKLIWIEAHVAGPPDKPFRTREKVFAVVR